MVLLPSVNSLVLYVHIDDMVFSEARPGRAKLYISLTCFFKIGMSTCRALVCY